MCYSLNHNYNKILNSDWLSTTLILALIGQYASCLSNWTVRAITRALKWLFFSLLAKKISEFVVFWLKKEPNISQILLKLWLIGNRTSCRPIQSVIILVIKQIGLPLRGRSILLISRMITDRIGLHSVLQLLPLLIIIVDTGLKEIYLPLLVTGIHCTMWWVWKYICQSIFLKVSVSVELR